MKYLEDNNAGNSICIQLYLILNHQIHFKFENIVQVFLSLAFWNETDLRNFNAFSVAPSKQNKRIQRTFCSIVSKTLFMDRENVMLLKSHVNEKPLHLLTKN
jgi:hypothetical protein